MKIEASFLDILIWVVADQARHLPRDYRCWYHGEAGDGDDDGLRVGADLDRDDFDFDDSLQESE